MKIRLIIISSLLASMIFMAGCGTETPMKDLREAAKEIDKIEQRSENIQSEEEAFKILKDLTSELKDVREAALALDDPYKDMKAGGEEIKEVKQSEDFKNKMAEFEKVNSDIDSSLAVISENVEPYKDNKEVGNMLEKLQTILISR